MPSKLLCLIFSGEVIPLLLPSEKQASLLRRENFSAGLLVSSPFIGDCLRSFYYCCVIVDCYTIYCVLFC
jgi:hypothetical protein